MSGGNLLALPEIIVLLLVLSLLGSAFFSGCETGLMAASRVRLQRMVVTGQTRAAGLLRQRKHLDDAILTCLLGTNLSNVLASAVATALLIGLLGPRGEFVAIMAVSLVLVALGEILPKILYREYPERLMLMSLPLLRGFRLLASPVRWPLAAYAKMLQRLQGDRPVHTPGLDRTTLATLLAAGEVLETRDRRFWQTMNRFLYLSNRHIGDIMRPRAFVQTLPAGVTMAQALMTAKRSGFSRLPVEGTSGDMVGYLLVRDLLLAEGSLAAHQPVPVDLVRTLLMVDSELSPYELFEDLHACSAQLAAVVDRNGRTLGIITLEDLIEEVTGAIADEFDQTEEQEERIP